MKVLKDCDSNGDGKIDYRDFCLMLVKMQLRSQLEHQSLAAFQEIDIDGNGFVSREELWKLMVKEFGSGPQTEEEVES